MKRLLLIVGALLVLLLAVAGFWAVFLRDDAPAPVSTEAGLEQLREDLAAEDEDQDPGPADQEPGPEDQDPGPEDQDAGPADQDPEPAPRDDGTDSESLSDEGLELGSQSQEADSPEPAPPKVGVAEGTWIVDDEFGEFDFDTASGSFAGFRVQEELTVGEVTAVGRTGDVSGSLTIEDGVLTAAEVTVDFTTIVSNDPRREHAIHNAIRTSVYPTATFMLTEPVQLDVEALEAGSTLDVDLVGNLTVKGNTSRVTFHLHPTIVEEDLGLIVGSAEIFWSDFGVTAPRAPIVVSVADHGIVEFQLVVRRQSTNGDS